MIKINLLSERRQAAKPKGPSIEIGANAENMGYVAILVIALGYCAWTWWSLSSELADVRAKVAQAKVDVEDVREGLRIIADLEAKKALIDKQVDIISALKKQRSIPVNLMNEINARLPDFLWFSAMSESGQTISFTGRATTPNAPANLYNNLSDSPYFRDVTLNQITKDRTGVNFSLTCTFAPGGEDDPQGS